MFKFKVFFLLSTIGLLGLNNQVLAHSIEESNQEPPTEIKFIAQPELSNQSSNTFVSKFKSSPKTDKSDSTSLLEQIQNYNNAEEDIEQVTNVNQLRDVRPTDWAFEALRSLVERYGCIAGYPDGTYRGQRALSRFEFAAGVNACLLQIERLIAASTADAIRKEDLAIIQKLYDEFGAELKTIRARVDNLDGRVTFLEENQFSTTTKLSGEVVFSFNSLFSGDNAAGQKIDRNSVFGSRTRLELNTSFTGDDNLFIRLQALGLTDFATITGTPMGQLFYTNLAPGAPSNEVAIDALYYQFPLGEKTTVFLEANAGSANDYSNTANPYLDFDGGTGAFTTFGTRSPIYYTSSGAGLGINHQFNDIIGLSLGYLSPTANLSEVQNGVFNGAYGATGQLTLTPNDNITVALTYANSYNMDFAGFVGSNRSNIGIALGNTPRDLLPTQLQPFAGQELPTSTNSYGLAASFKLTPKFVLGGWVGYSNTRTLKSIPGFDADGNQIQLTIGDPVFAVDDTGNQILDPDGNPILLNDQVPLYSGRGSTNIWYYAATLSFPDLFKEGNLGAIIFGVEPRVSGINGPIRNTFGRDRDTSFHIEGLYQMQITDNITITPGIIVITSPDHNAKNDSLVIGVVRTTFQF